MIRLLNAAMSGSCVTRMTVIWDSSVQPHKKLHDLDACFGVEVARRLVRENDRRVVHERPRDGDPLLLPSGELVRMMAFPAFEAPRSSRTLLPVLAAPAAGSPL